MATIKLAEDFENWASQFVDMEQPKEKEMKIDAKFFCNHCGSTFSAKDTEQASIRCPVCDGYKVSLQLDLWNDPDPTGFSSEVDSEGIPE